MDLVCVSHFIQNDKATSVDFCSVFFFYFEPSFICRCVFPARIKLSMKKKKKKKTRKRAREKSPYGKIGEPVSSSPSVSPSFLISRVNFHCVQQKRRRRGRTTASIDGWMVRCTDGGDLHPLHNIRIVRKRRRRKKREKSKTLAKTINNNS